MKKHSWMFFLSMCCCAYAQAASFDCEQARSATEKLICSKEELSNLDSQLGEAYTSVQKDLEQVDADRLKRDQLHWLRSVRNRCVDAACLETAYKERINQIDPLADRNLTCDEMRRWPERAFGGFVDLGSGTGSPTEVDYRCPDSLSQQSYMRKLLDIAERIRGDGGSRVCTGTIVHAQWRYYQFSLTQAGIAPQTLITQPTKRNASDWKTFVQENPSGTVAYFRQWGERSHFNQTLYAEFVSEFDKAAVELVRLYVKKRGMTPDEARAASMAALILVLQRAAGSAPESEWRGEAAVDTPLLDLLRAGPASRLQVSQLLSGPGRVTTQALSVALIHNQPLDVVALLADELVDGGLFEPPGPTELGDSLEAQEPQAMDVPEAEYEPLLSLALGNYANLEYLLRKKFPVDVVNDFGKTTLFYAIGSNNHAAVELLLRYKANVNHTYKSAKELRPNDDECAYPGLRHTRRSTLMHAAQNSDVRMLQILLKAGARLDARDDVGFNAHDYALMGNNRDNAQYLSSLGLEPASPSYSREPVPSVREQPLLSTLRIEGYIKKLAVSPGRPDLLVASVTPWDTLDGGPTTGLYLISIAVPVQPRVVGVLSGINAHDFVLSPDGKRIYFLELSHQKSPPGKKYGLGVADVSDPIHPILSTQLEGDFMVMHLTQDGRTLYLQEREIKPDFSRGLLVYGVVADELTLMCSNPFGATSIERPVFAYGFASFPDEPLLAIADRSRTLLLFDTRYPCAPNKLMETRFEGGADSMSGAAGRILVTRGLNKYRITDALELQASYAVNLTGGLHVNTVAGLTVAVVGKDVAVLRTKPGGTYVLTDRFRSIPDYAGGVVSTATGHVYVGGKGGLGVGVVPLR